MGPQAQSRLGTNSPEHVKAKWVCRAGPRTGKAVSSKKQTLMAQACSEAASEGLNPLEGPQFRGL